MEMPKLREFIKEELKHRIRSDCYLMNIMELKYMENWRFSCKAKKAESLRKFLHKMTREGELEVHSRTPQGQSVEIFYKLCDKVEDNGTIRDLFEKEKIRGKVKASLVQKFINWLK